MLGHNNNQGKEEHRIIQALIIHTLTKPDARWWAELLLTGLCLSPRAVGAGVEVLPWTPIVWLPHHAVLLLQDAFPPPNTTLQPPQPIFHPIQLSSPSLDTNDSWLYLTSWVALPEDESSFKSKSTLKSSFCGILQLACLPEHINSGQPASL